MILEKFYLSECECIEFGDLLTKQISYIHIRCAKHSLAHVQYLFIKYLISVSKNNVLHCFLNNSRTQPASDLRLSPSDRGPRGTSIYIGIRHWIIVGEVLIDILKTMYS